MNLVFNGTLPDAQIWARRALEHCSATAKIQPDPDAWRIATEGEAKSFGRQFSRSAPSLP
jgi:hypothetical protein